MDDKIIKVVNEARWIDGQNVRNRLDDITYNPMRSQEEFAFATSATSNSHCL